MKHLRFADDLIEISTDKNKLETMLHPTGRLKTENPQ